MRRGVPRSIDLLYVESRRHNQGKCYIQRNTNETTTTMSSDDELFSDDYDDDDFFSDASVSDSSTSSPVRPTEPKNILIDAVDRGDTETVLRLTQEGANVNVIGSDSESLLCMACERGHNEIVRILLDAGADARWIAISRAISEGHLSIVQMLLQHDNGLLEAANNYGFTPLLSATLSHQSHIAHFLLDQGANACATTHDGKTTLLLECWCGPPDLDIVRRLLAAGIEVDARDKDQHTPLHRAAEYSVLEVVRELVVEHNANMFALDKNGNTPFDHAASYRSAERVCPLLIECYIDKLTQEHGRLALHCILGLAEYSFSIDDEFHPPLNPLRIRLPLGQLTLHHLRNLFSNLDVELIRNRDERGMLPIHIACRNKAPVEVLALIAEQDATTLHMADYIGALPLHECCSDAEDDSSVRFLVEQGGVGTLAARDHQGAVPLHIMCGSTNPSLRTVQYMIQSLPRSVAARTKAGQYPFVIAACSSSTASLSVVYELVRTNPGLVTPH